MSTGASESAITITRGSQSNLALSFVALDPRRRRDISVFYAFCRVIDDIADARQSRPEEKRKELQRWREWVEAPGPGEPKLAAALRVVLDKYAIEKGLLHALLDGVVMDLVPQCYQTFEDLRSYCFKVASVVGLVSIEIFGYRNPSCRTYAEELGLALQLTNIVRDVGDDLENGGRIYLPLEDLARFGYTVAELEARTWNERFVTLMEFEAERARGFYRAAIAALPPEDRWNMRAAEIMRVVYSTLLERIERGGFRVFEERFRLGRLEKLWLICRGLAGTLWRK